MRRILAVDDDRHTRIRLKQCGFAANSSDPPNNYRERADTVEPPGKAMRRWLLSSTLRKAAEITDTSRQARNDRQLPL